MINNKIEMQFSY